MAYEFKENEFEISGRIVRGHPLKGKAQEYEGRPCIGKDGKQQVQYYFAVAVPKGDPKIAGIFAKIEAFAKSKFPSLSPRIATPGNFRFQIVNGDSVEIGRKGGPAPASKVGYPGNYIFDLKTYLPGGCAVAVKMADGSYRRLNESEIKCGDFVRVVVYMNEKGGDNSGIYLNPSKCLLTSEGDEIIPAASFADVFSDSPAPVQSTTAPVAPPIVPAHDFVNPPAPPVEERYKASNGVIYTRGQLVGFGWEDAQIAALPKA